jgi:hypothetical protein
MKKATSLLIALAMTTTAMATLTACEEHEHVYDTTQFIADEDYHWYACEEPSCQMRGAMDAHDFEKTANGLSLVCTVCGKTIDANTAGDHEHSAAEEWTQGSNYHWHACEVAGCTERIDEQEHYFGDPVIIQSANMIRRTYTCETCGYEKIEETEIDSVIDGEASWDQAFSNLEMINFSMYVYFYENDQVVNTNHCRITETSAYYHIEDFREFYTTQKDDGTYSTYYRLNPETPFALLDNDTDAYLKAAQNETMLKISYESHFDSFTYDESLGAYVYDGVVAATAYYPDGITFDTIYCYNNVVKVADGEITYIACDYYFNYTDDEDMREPEDMSIPEHRSHSFVYYDIGMTSITIPLEVIENAIPDNGEIGRDYINGDLSE